MIITMTRASASASAAIPAAGGFGRDQMEGSCTGLGLHCGGAGGQTGGGSDREPVFARGTFLGGGGAALGEV